MPYAKKIVLHCPNGYEARLDALVEDFIRDGVMCVCIIGKDSDKVEDIIDELVVGDGSRDYNLLTSSFPNESVEEVVEFAKFLGVEFEGSEVDIIEL
ncbi:MAG: hypothetical protein OEY86_20985 [Nitrospira sp.]|nr:hypothetical protein [Nitrospira sp.]